MMLFMIIVDMDELAAQAERSPRYISLSRWVTNKETDKLFQKCNALYKLSQLNNGELKDHCPSTDCVGCAECGDHEYGIQLDEHTRLNFGWNTWRGYQNGLNIRAYNHEKEYWEDIYYCYNSLDVTNWKDFWLNEFDRKYLLHVNLRAIMQLKKWKAEYDTNQTKLNMGE